MFSEWDKQADEMYKLASVLATSGIIQDEVTRNHIVALYKQIAELKRVVAKLNTLPE